MKKFIFLFCTILFATGIINNGVISAQEWSQFRGSDRECRAAGFKVPAAWPQELMQQWKITVGSGDATPAMIGKNIYTHTRQGDEEIIRCIDGSTGQEIWKSSYPAPAVTGPAASAHPGPRSSPAGSDGKIVTFGATGILTCLDAASGKILWRKENPEMAVPQFFTGTSPLIFENTCIIHTGTKDNGTVSAFDLNTGKVRWEWKGDGPAYASPAVMYLNARKIIVVQTEKNLVGLSFSDGKMAWQTPTPPQQRFYNAASPFVYRDIIYYTGQGTGMKAIKVVHQPEGCTTKELWSNPEIGGKWNTPVLVNGYLYGFTDTRRMYCVNASTGEKAWVDENVNSDFATIVDCGQVLIGFPSTGNLIVLKPDPKVYTEVAKYKVTETPVYTFPIIAGDVIYIKDSENLISYRIK